MNNPDVLSLDEIALTDELVANYLQENPEFFNRQPEVLTRVKMVDEQRGIISLVERQQQLLRHKVHSLEEEITQLMTVAQQNENLFAVYNDLYLVLLDCNSLPEILNCLNQTVVELLSLSRMGLWLAQPLTETIVHSNILTADGAEIFTNRLATEPFYFGRLQQHEQECLFGEHTPGSVVLIKLTHHDTDVGMLVISSEDVNHFDPRMDTLLLGQFRRLVAKLISQFI